MWQADAFDYHASFLGAAEADAALQCLWKELDWSQREITLFGRKVMQPRLVAWYGDPEARYRYSGLTLEPLAWHPLLARLRARLESFTGQGFNSVLANAYRDGRDSMGWHRDDERELGAEPFIASLSLGAERRFLVRPLGSPEGVRARSRGLTLAHGSLLVMKGQSQRDFQHSLPKTRRPCGLRINLTYRKIET
ncbi:MAG: alpha-ketoglutarate-dependent dioxygenase AlkB [Gammaproteobacteria bacterium]|nr:alpha-ketoglutarate-dependent dioxygenase AlkB [Gammaproteobacteria bacterium]